MPAFEEIEIGDDLPEVQADLSMETVRRFARAAHMMVGRFIDHDKARKEGLPGAIVPGIMSQALLASLVHRWAPGARIHELDTTFRAHILVDSEATLCGVVTDIDSDERTLEIDLTIQNASGEARVVGTARTRLL